MIELQAAKHPTMYFIGVSTSQSSIMKVFPAWAKELGLKAVMKGIDLPLHASASEYRRVVEFLKYDPLSLGALVTTHKLDLFACCRDLFDYVDPFAERLEEVSSLSKNSQGFCAHAKDPITSGRALMHFVPENYWQDYGGEVLILGAGGSALAMSMYLSQQTHEDSLPRRITITNRSLPRLDEARRKLEGLNPKVDFEFAHCPSPMDNDALIASLPPHSLVVNATGLGKDAPGSPTTDAVVFPHDSLIWEINYRGDLIFMQQAQAQMGKKHLHIEDGWEYFIHGWTEVMAEVFHINISDAVLDQLSRIARKS